MKSLTDENFRDLFRPVVNGSGFITDASRRQEIAMLKKQNFLAFNPLQFNIFYFVAAVIIVLGTIGALISNNVGEENNAKASKPDFHTLKREVTVPAPVKPVVADTAVVKQVDTIAPVTAKPVLTKADTAKHVAPQANNTVVSEAKKLMADLKYASQGLPKLFVKPEVALKEPKLLLPKLPDSLPPQKKPAVRKPKPLQTASATDTGRATVTTHKADSSPVTVPAPATPEVPVEQVAPPQN